MKIVMLHQAITPAQEKELRDYFDKRGWGFWHWLPGSWLIDAPGAEVGFMTELRDEFMRVAKNIHVFVFEATEVGAGWAGFGPGVPGNDMYAWIEKHWAKPTPSASLGQYGPTS